MATGALDSFQDHRLAGIASLASWIAYTSSSANAPAEVSQCLHLVEQLHASTTRLARLRDGHAAASAPDDLARVDAVIDSAASGIADVGLLLLDRYSRPTAADDAGRPRSLQPARIPWAASDSGAFAALAHGLLDLHAAVLGELGRLKTRVDSDMAGWDEAEPREEEHRPRLENAGMLQDILSGITKDLDHMANGQRPRPLPAPPVEPPARPWDDIPGQPRQRAVSDVPLDTSHHPLRPQPSVQSLFGPRQPYAAAQDGTWSRGHRASTSELATPVSPIVPAPADTVEDSRSIYAAMPPLDRPSTAPDWQQHQHQHQQSPADEGSHHAGLKDLFTNTLEPLRIMSRPLPHERRTWYPQTTGGNTAALHSLPPLPPVRPRPVSSLSQVSLFDAPEKPSSPVSHRRASSRPPSPTKSGAPPAVWRYKEPGTLSRIGSRLSLLFAKEPATAAEAPKPPASTNVFELDSRAIAAMPDAASRTHTPVVESHPRHFLPHGGRRPLPPEPGRMLPPEPGSVPTPLQVGRSPAAPHSVPAAAAAVERLSIATNLIPGLIQHESHVHEELSDEETASAETPSEAWLRTTRMFQLDSAQSTPMNRYCPTGLSHDM